MGDDGIPRAAFRQENRGDGSHAGGKHHPAHDLLRFIIRVLIDQVISFETGIFIGEQIQVGIFDTRVVITGGFPFEDGSSEIDIRKNERRGLVDGGIVRKGWILLLAGMVDQGSDPHFGWFLRHSCS